MPEVLEVVPPRVRISSSHPVVRFAAAELSRYLAAGGGPSLTAADVDESLGAGLAPLPDGCRFRLETDPTRLIGADGRGLLSAVYRYLEQLGWRWFFPGPLGEVHRPDLPLPRAAGEPVAERVALDLSHRRASPLWRLELRQLIDWLGKHGFETLALEGRDLAPAELAELAPDLSRRGIRLELGGDIVPRLLAETKAAERRPLHHRQGLPREERLEVADATALAQLPRVAAAELARFGEIGGLRLREPGDAPLTAEQGRELPHSERRLAAVVEAVEAGLRGHAAVWVWRPTSRARRRFIAPETVGLIVPIDRRNLGEPLHETDDDRHEFLLETIHREVDRAGGLEVVLPYVSFASLQNLCAPLTRVILGDLRTLQRHGVKRLSMALLGAASWLLYPLNTYTIARAMAAPEVGRASLLRDWCEGLYPEASDEMYGYYDWFERTMLPLWRLRHGGRDPAVRAWRAGERRARKVMDELLAGVEALPEVRRPLAEAEAKLTAPISRECLRRERDAFELNYLHVQLWLFRLQAQFAHPTLALHAAARDLVSQLRARLADLPPARGAAMATVYAATVDRLAHWCGHDSERPVEVDGG